VLIEGTLCDRLPIQPLARFLYGSHDPLTVRLLISRLTLGCALIVLFVVDLRHHRLPNAVTLPGILAGLLFSLFGPPGWTASLRGIVLGGGLLWLIGAIQYRIRGHERLGMGDAKMLAMIGAFVGLPLTLVALVLALCAGSLISVGLIAFRRDALPPVLPFGTFLAAGAVAAAAVGAALIDWYVALW